MSSTAAKRVKGDIGKSIKSFAQTCLHGQKVSRTNSYAPFQSKADGALFANIDSKPTRLSGPDVRFLCFEIVKTLEAHEPLDWKAALEDTFLYTGNGPIRSLLAVMDRAHNALADGMYLIDYENSQQVGDFAKRVPQLGTLWQSGWRTEKPCYSSAAQFSVPVLVILPLGLYDRLCMTASVLLPVAHGVDGPEPKKGSRRMQVKPIHCK